MKRKTAQAGKPTDLRCHWCDGPLNMSGHTNILANGQKQTVSYLVGVSCQVVYGHNRGHSPQLIAVPCEHDKPYEQTALWGMPGEYI